MKKAFTLLELIIIIVIVGILSSIILSRTKDDSLEQAALQLMSHIRYTQHLAMMDDKIDRKDSKWMQKRWQIIFCKQGNSNNKWAYTIFADTYGTSSGKPNKTEIAINPLNLNQRMTGGYNSAAELNVTHSTFIGMKTMNLGMTYGITNMSFSCNQRIVFDYSGRPMKTDISSNIQSYESNQLMDNNCTISLSNSNGTISLEVEKQTGYVKLLN